MKVNWFRLKSIIKNDHRLIFYSDNVSYYRAWTEIDGFQHFAVINKTPVRNREQIDFEDNFLPLVGPYKGDLDNDGRSVHRVAAATKGWSYLAHAFEFETSNLSSLNSDDYNGVATPNMEIKCYDNTGTEITVQATADTSAAKTVVTWRPSYDFELVQGQVRQQASLTDDCYLWVIGGMLEGPAYTKEFVRGVNMKFIGLDEVLKTDGRASKYMKYSTEGAPYQTNQMQYILRHEDALGLKHKFMIILEYYRA